MITRRRHLFIRHPFRFIRTKVSSLNSGMIHKLLTPAHSFCDSFADVIAPVNFVMLSYLDAWALNATGKNRARKEATLKNSKSRPSSLSKQSLPKSSRGLATMSSISEGRKLNADNQQTPFHGRIHDHIYWHDRIWNHYRWSP